MAGDTEHRDARALAAACVDGGRHRRGVLRRRQSRARAHAELAGRVDALAAERRPSGRSAARAARVVARAHPRDLSRAPHRRAPGWRAPGHGVVMVREQLRRGVHRRRMHPVFDPASGPLRQLQARRDLRRVRRLPRPVPHLVPRHRIHPAERLAQQRGGLLDAVARAVLLERARHSDARAGHRAVGRPDIEGDSRDASDLGSSRGRFSGWGCSLSARWSFGESRLFRSPATYSCSCRCRFCSGPRCASDPAVQVRAC